MHALLPRPLHSTPTALPILQCRHGLALQEVLSSACDAPVGMRTVPVARSYALPACNQQRQWQNQYSRGQRQAASAAKQNSSPQHGNSRPSMYNISRNWDQLVGWEVLLQRNGFFIGTVQEVRNHHLTDKLHQTAPDFLHQHLCHCYSTIAIGAAVATVALTPPYLDISLTLHKGSNAQQYIPPQKLVGLMMWRLNSLKSLENSSHRSRHHLLTAIPPSIFIMPSLSLLSVLLSLLCISLTLPCRSLTLPCRPLTLPHYHS